MKSLREIIENSYAAAALAEKELTQDALYCLDESFKSASVNQAKTRQAERPRVRA